MTGTVTIPLDEYNLLKEKEKALSLIEYNDKAFIVYQVNESFSYQWKRFYGVGDDVTEALRMTNDDLRKRLENTESEVKELRVENYNLRNKPEPWYKFW
jgi:hypothetical protein